MNFYTIAGVAHMSDSLLIVSMRNGSADVRIVGEDNVTAFLNWYNAEYRKWAAR